MNKKKYYDKLTALEIKHPKIKFLGKCLHNLNNKEFVEDVLNINKCPAKLTIHSLGDKNHGKLIFLEQCMTYGFFDQHRRLLETLMLCDLLQATPVVYYGKNFAYHEEELINGTNNGFEYYFEPLSNVSYEDAITSESVIIPQLENRIFGWRDLHKQCSKLGRTFVSRYIEDDDPFMSDNYLDYYDSLAEMQRKYIRLNENTREYIYSCIRDLFGDKKIIGVHARGTDFKIHNKNVPIYVDPKQHMEKIDEIIDQYDAIFLATDNVETINLFKDKYGSKLLCYSDVFRAKNGDVGIHMTENNRKNHHYKLGLEVLRDMYSLSHCDALIAGFSGVSCMAYVEKKSRNEEYHHFNIISNGFYS